MSETFKFNTIEEILEDLKAGKNIVLVDDEDRENEGDVICAAEFATLENVNFMAAHARGLICMPMAKEYVDKLELHQMCVHNTDNHETAFTVSIDHVSTTTGISAYERSITAMKTVDDDARPEDFRRPGHMFAYGGDRRLIESCRIETGRTLLRDHERRRHDGPDAGACKVC